MSVSSFPRIGDLEMVAGYPMTLIAREVHLSENGDALCIDVEGCYLNEEKVQMINRFKDTAFEVITVGYNKAHVNDMLRLIAKHFKPPQCLNLDLFFAHKNEHGKVVAFDDIPRSEEAVRSIFANWAKDHVDVIFRCNDLILHVFDL